MRCESFIVPRWRGVKSFRFSGREDIVVLCWELGVVFGFEAGGSWRGEKMRRALGGFGMVEKKEE